uniref:Uncharacterized protein n=1 Tax=Globodera rostochiensis TaxID=31243 RepID=A0A914HXF6_GLORO
MFRMESLRSPPTKKGAIELVQIVCFFPRMARHRFLYQKFRFPFRVDRLQLGVRTQRLPFLRPPNIIAAKHQNYQRQKQKMPPPPPTNPWRCGHCCLMDGKAFGCWVVALLEFVLLSLDWERAM